MISLTQHYIPITLNKRKIPGFLKPRVIEQGSASTRPAPRLHSLSKFVSVCYVSSRKNSFHQLSHRNNRGKKKGKAISPALLQPRNAKLTGTMACLHISPSNGTFATHSREQKLLLQRYASHHNTINPIMNSVLNKVRLTKFSISTYEGILKKFFLWACSAYESADKKSPKKRWKKNPGTNGLK